MEYTPQELAMLQAITDVRSAVINNPKMGVGDKQFMLGNIRALKLTVLQGALKRTIEDQEVEDDGVLESATDKAQIPVPLKALEVQWWENLSQRFEQLGFIHIPCNCGDNTRRMNWGKIKMDLTAELSERRITMLQQNGKFTPKAFNFVWEEDKSWDELVKLGKFADIVDAVLEIHKGYMEYLNPEVDEPWNREDLQMIKGLIHSILRRLGLYEAGDEWMEVKNLKSVHPPRNIWRIQGGYVTSWGTVDVKHENDSVSILIEIQDGEDTKIDVIDEKSWVLACQQLHTWNVINL